MNKESERLEKEVIKEFLSPSEAGNKEEKHRPSCHEIVNGMPMPCFCPSEAEKVEKCNGDCVRLAVECPTHNPRTPPQEKVECLAPAMPGHAEFCKAKPQEDWRVRFEKEFIMPQEGIHPFVEEHKMMGIKDCDGCEDNHRTLIAVGNKLKALESFITKEIDAAEEKGYVRRGIVEAEIKKGIALAERARIKEVLEIVSAKYWKNPASKGHIIRAIQEDK